MTDKANYTATVKTKRCKNTGITEEVISEFHTRPGRCIMAVVELRVDDAHNKHDAPDHVDLIIETIEPALEPYFDDHLRELVATKFKNRVLKSDEDQLQIETQGDLARPLEAIVADGKAHLVDLEDEPAEDPVPVG